MRLTLLGTAFTFQIFLIVGFLFFFLPIQDVKAQQTVSIRDETSNGETRPGATIYTYAVQFPGGTVPEFYYDAYDWNVVTTKAYIPTEFTSTSIKIQWLEGPGDATIYYSAQTYSGNFAGSRLVMIGTLEDVEVYALPATQITSDSFVANWNPVPGVSEYRLYVAEDANFQYPIPGFDKYSGLYVTGTSHTVSVPVPSEYFYRVRAVSGSWSSGSSNTVQVEMFVPGIPTARPATEITSTSFLPNWDPLYRTDNVQVEVSTNSSFTEIVTWEYQFVKKAITGLTPGTVYYYRLKGRTNAGLESGYSNVVSFITIPDTPVFNMPSDVTSTSFKVSWSVCKGTSNYWIEVAPTPSFQQRMIDEPVYQNDLLIANLSPGRQYFYRVKAQNASGSSPYSAIKMQLTIPADAVAKPATNINATTFTANWDMVQGASNYTIEISTSATFNTELKNFTTSGSHLDILELSPSTIYYYRIIVSNSSGSSNYSNTIQTATLPITPVATSASAINSNSFVANWNSVYATSYRLDVSTDINFTSYVSGYNNRTVNGTNLSVTNLLPANYYYRIRAVNALGNPSANSNIIEVTQLAHNYIRTIDVTVAGITTSEQVEAADINSRFTRFNFYDGLGRTDQIVSVKSSPTYQDIVQPIEYDAMGRENKKYLPYTDGNNGWYKSNAVTAALNFYAISNNKIARDVQPYTETIFEPSPLNRILKQGSPGIPWQPNADPYSMSDNTIKKRYEFNAADEVVLFKYESTTGTVSTGASERYYQPNQLYANKTYDEKNNEVIEYVDKEGRTIGKKVFVKIENNEKQYAETYYIYDDFGNLVAVLPPEAIEKLKMTLGLN